MIDAYFPVLVFFVIAIGLGLAPLLIGRFFRPNRPNPGKLSAYECGFTALSHARKPFDVRFYLVAILFILFDLETAFLVPWSVALKDLGHPAFWAMMLFLTVLVVGFVYEWKKGALTWE